MTRSNVRFPKATAVAFALLMLVPSLPLVNAEHTDGQVPDVPGLPHARTTDECIGTSIPREVAAALAAAQSRDAGYLAEDKGVPAWCGPGASDYEQLVHQLDGILDLFRENLTQLEEDARARFENLYPEGESVKPQVTLLDDRFDGRGIGGIGGWEVVTADGGEPAFTIAPRTDFNGTSYEWRFGDDEGYERGTREFLVSPEIDLRALRGDADQARKLTFAKEYARAQLRSFCYGDGSTSLPGGFIQIGNFGPFLCGDMSVPSSFGLDLVAEYEAALDMLAADSPVGQAVATLEFAYRHNFAETDDGARVWIYVGDQAPDRLTLFDPSFGRTQYVKDCEGYEETNTGGLPVVGGSGVNLQQTLDNFAAYQSGACKYTPRGGVVLELPGRQPTAALPPAGTAAAGETSTAARQMGFTGYTPQTVTVRTDLSNFTNQRAWILVEVATTADLNQGGDFFSPALFRDSQKDYGFALERVKVVGEGYPRNVRLHEMTQPPFVTYRDDDGNAVRARTAVPPGNERPLVHVHNAGAYTENATVTVTITERKAGAETGSVRTLAPIQVRDLRPNEVRDVPIDWPAVKDGHDYDIATTLTVEQFDAGDLGGAAADPTDPSRTDVGFPNWPGVRPDDGNFLENLTTVKAFVRRDLVPVSVSTDGAVVTVCGTEPLPSGACTPLYAGKKGAPRYVLTGVRNEGNTLVDGLATLHLTLDGVEKPEAILDGAERRLDDFLPLEERTLEWSLALNDPGAYVATISYTVPGTSYVGSAVTRSIFTQQTTGLVCYDNLDDERECGTLWSVDMPKTLEDGDFTAAAFAADGTLFATTPVSQDDGHVYVRHTNGTWQRLESISNATLSAKVGGGALPATGAGAIRALTFSPTGTLYMVGDNGTMLSRSATGVYGALRLADPTNETGAHFDASAWWNNTLHVIGNGSLFRLNGSLLENVNLTYVDLADGETKLAEKRLRAIAANATNVYLGGDDGALWVGNATRWRLLQDWGSQPDLRDPLLDSKKREQWCTEGGREGGLCNRTITQFAFHDGAVYAAGVDGLLLASTDGARFARVQSPPDLSTGASVPVAVSGAGKLKTSIDSPAQGAELTAGDDVVVNGTASFVPRAYPRWAKGADCQLRSLSLRDGADDGQADCRDDARAPSSGLIGGAVYTFPYDGPAIHLVPGGRVGGTLYVTGNESSSGQLAVALKNGDQTLGTQVVSFAHSGGAGGPVPVAVDFALDGLASDAGLTRFAFELHLPPGTDRLSLDGPASYLELPLSAERADVSVQVAVDSPAFAENLLPVKGKQNWSAQWDLAQVAAGGHAVYVRAVAYGVYGPASRLGVDVRAGPTLLTTHLGTLFLVDGAGAAFTCAQCLDRVDAGWTRPALAVPYVEEEGRPVPTPLKIAVANDATTLMIGRGVVLEYDFRGTYENHGDWSTDPWLVGEHGGVQTVASLTDVNPSTHGGNVYRIAPESDASSAAKDIRVTVRHHLREVLPTAPAEIRVIHKNYVTGQSHAGQNVTHTCPAYSPTTAGVNASALCDRFVYARVGLDAPSDTTGWETTVFDVKLTDVSAKDVALEFVARGGAAWAIDHAIVEDLSSPSAAPILAFDGFRSNGTALPPCGKDQREGCNVGIPQETKLPVEALPAARWEPFFEHHEVLDVDRASAWHVSRALADRPVWVANDEVYGAAPGGSSPRILDNWNTRLVTPVIDLTSVYDPVVSFSHLYSFRFTPNELQSGVVDGIYGDAGFVELQYLRKGLECGSSDPTVTCWSRFYRLVPEGGYPDAAANGINGTITAQGTKYPPAPLPRDAAPQAYWGRNTRANEQGFIEEVRYTDLYEEARFRLDGSQPIPVNLTGREVRLGFRLVSYHLEDDPAGPERRASTDTSYFNASSLFQASNPSSWAGEGWYITDFKVQGARLLGVDLEASNLTFPVGYDFQRVGVGPGERVPVNFTVTNRGVFEALGYTARVEIRRVTDAVLGRTDLVETIPLAQQPVLDAGKSVNHTVFWQVPEVEGASYTFTVIVEPIGIDRDEDWTDNTALLGTVAKPVLARTSPEFHVEFFVTPENATSDITRYVPIYVSNTGNVPLEKLTIKRTVAILSGQLSRTLEERTWTTEQASPAGTRLPLAALDENFDPVNDLFWKAPERANYYFLVDAKVDGTSMRSTVDKRVSAFATYLFDDVEGGVRGESATGDWTFGEGWDVQSPGFLSSDAYGFGDLVTGRLEPGAVSEIVSPVIDLSNARSANLAMFHRFLFEEGFDGGIVEASVDGGATWTPITPVADLANKLDHGYSTPPMSAASALHPDGDPENELRAFTGDSAALAEAVEGWILSQFDLTDYDGVTKRDVFYDRLSLLNFKNDSYAPMNLTGESRYRAPTWGALEDERYWAVENLTEGRVAGKANAVDDHFWWSGSAMLTDDGLRPASNYFLTIPLNLTTFEPAGPEIVEVEWWEWVDRTDKRGFYLAPMNSSFAKSDLRGAFEWTPNSQPQTWRLNVTAPQVVERDGRWYRMASTLTSDYKGGVVDLSFVYSPHAQANANLSSGIADRYRDDPGFAIDGFTLRSYTLVNGQRTNERVLLNETGAWENATVTACNSFAVNPPTSITVPCWRSSGSSAPPVPGTRVPAAKDVYGLVWSRVTTLPNMTAAWYVENVRDEKGDDVRPTGEPVQAFYSGDVTCRAPSANDCAKEECGPSNVCSGATANATCAARQCVMPNTESRLVTPAVDLALVAGDSAALTFWHRYAFHQAFSRQDPIGSGGAVEVQVFDPNTNTWGEWQQIFPNLSADDVLRTSPRTLTDDAGPARYGYSSYTANNTDNRGGAGVYQFDPPFENMYNESLEKAYQYYYSGKSTSAPGNQNGWVLERFDVSEHIGKKVRFGFHFFTSGLQRSTQSSASACYEVATPAGMTCKAGWWIREASVVGDVLAGDQVLLRMRAATDGNVDEGRWQLDDIGLFGSRYERNVAVFVGAADERYGAIGGDTTTIPITVRNLGAFVRRDLAVEIRQFEDEDMQGVTLNFTGSAPVVQYDPTELAGGIRLGGIDLAPGASTTVLLHVRAPKDLPELEDDARKSLLVMLKQFNPSAARHVRIDDNEVAGFLEQWVDFHVRARGQLAVDATSILPAAPQVGEDVRFTVPLRNDGFSTLVVNTTCSAVSIHEFVAKDHTRDPTEEVTVAASYGCRIVDGARSTTLLPGEAADVVFAATPTTDGTLRFRVDGTVYDTRAQRPFDDVVGSVPVGRSPVLWAENFTDVNVMSGGNFTIAQGVNPSMQRSTERGFTERGALHLGRSEAGGEQTQTGVHVVYTKPVDLHNLTTGAYLTFWHLDRFTRGDGAQVRAQVLMREATPAASNAWLPIASGNWSTACLLRPDGDYEGRVLSQLGGPDGNGGQIPQDLNPGYVPSQPGQVLSSPKDFFTSGDGGKNGVPDDAWEFAAFDLSQTCTVSYGQKTEMLPLVGHTVRFVFAYYAGDVPQQPIVGRTASGGWYVDDLSVSPMRLTVRPAEQQTRVLDNTTKTYHVVVKNEGPAVDVVRVSYDAANSSAPAGSVLVDGEPLVLLPGEERIVPVQVTLPRDPSLLPTRFIAQILAKSEFDLNAQGKTRLLVDFAPREWAELVVAVGAPDAPVQEGTEKFIPVTIENNGLVPSVASTLRVVDRWVDNGVPREKVEELELPSMSSFFTDADDATRILEYRWHPEKGSLGEHTLTFIADPLVLGQEYTRDNNVVTVKAQVTKLLIPDLSVAGEDAVVLRNAVGGVVSPTRDAEVTRYQVTAGEIVTFEVTVKNLGAGGVTNVDVRTFIGQLSLPAKTVPYIAPGGEVVLTFNWLSQRGDYDLEVLVRSEAVEVTTDNNRHPAIGVVRLTVKDYEVSVSADAPDEIVEPGTEIPVPFTLTNTGNAGEEIRLDAQLPPEWTIRFPRTEFFLRSEETYEATATVGVPAGAVAGEQFISILAVSRENPMKVAASRTPVEVRAFYDGRVLPSISAVSPPEFVLPIALANDGNSVEPWTVNLRLPAGWTTAEALPAKAVVTAHGTSTLELRVKVPAGTQPGVRDVDVLATMADGTPVNGTVSVELLPRRGATVALGASEPVGASGALAYPIVVENVGNIKAPFRVVLTRAAPGLDVRVEPADFDLAPGQKGQARLLVTPQQGVPSGDYLLQTYALFDGVHPDTAEGRANYGSVPLRLERPDVRIVAVEQTPRVDVEEGDRVVVKVTVTNGGATPVTALPLHLYADDVFIGETVLATLVPGETSDVLLNWTAIRGEHTLTVVVDPYEDTVDIDREDNAVSLQAQVADGGPLGGVAAGRLDTPAPGLAGILIAFAAALALVALPARSRRLKK